MKERAISDANEKAKIVLDIMDGVGEYVNQTLKPTVFSMLPELQDNPHLFVSEILSTSRIRNIIMEKSGHGVVNFAYKRLSQNPRNPVNQLDKNFFPILSFFEEKKAIKQWQGINSINGKKNLIIARSVYVTSDCLRCHGVPEMAPRGVIAKYGDKAGFGFKEGDIMGMELVAIPMDIVLNEITQTLINIIMVGMFFIFLLFLTIEATFIKHVGFPLNKLVTHFKKISQNRYNENTLFEQSDNRDDEISHLINSFNIMIKDLNDAYENLLGNANALQTIVNGISDPLALVNADCSIVVLNNTYQEWISKKIPCVLMPKEDSSCKELPVCQKFMEALSGKKIVINEYKNPSNNYYLIHFYPIFDKNNNVVQIVHYIQDLTHIKNIEVQIIQSDKMASIGKLAAGVAHEINNPLSIIKCYTDLLLKEVPEDSSLKDDLMVIDKHIYSCKNIIDRLLYFSRNNNEEKESKDLNDITEEIILLVQKQFLKDNIKIYLNRSEIPEIIINPNKIKQVVLNILMNSRDAMKDGGIISISSFFNKEKNQIEMIFSDTGCGIAKDDMKKIFDPFFTTKKQGEGTGLGLFISYNIIKEHNGDIKVHSTLDKGTDFIIILPLENNLNK